MIYNSANSGIHISDFRAYGTVIPGVLVLGPHPDDPPLYAAGIMENAVNSGVPVKVVFATNGDFSGYNIGLTLVRQAIACFADLGVSSADVNILGYGDACLAKYYHASTDKIIVPSQAIPPIFPFQYQTKTYSDPSYPEYHLMRFGSHASYNRASFRLDLETIINEFRPTDIYITSVPETHPDHVALNMFTVEAILDIKKSDPSYSPTLHDHWFMSMMVIRYGLLPMRTMIQCGHLRNRIFSIFSNGAIE